jgi:hypothetical protein
MHELGFSRLAMRVRDTDLGLIPARMEADSLRRRSSANSTLSELEAEVQLTTDPADTSMGKISSSSAAMFEVKRKETAASLTEYATYLGVGIENEPQVILVRPWYSFF